MRGIVCVTLQKHDSYIFAATRVRPSANYARVCVCSGEILHEKISKWTLGERLLSLLTQIFDDLGLCSSSKASRLGSLVPVSASPMDAILGLTSIRIEILGYDFSFADSLRKFCLAVSPQSESADDVEGRILIKSFVTILTRSFFEFKTPDEP